jgi:hypothetical protein
MEVGPLFIGTDANVRSSQPDYGVSNAIKRRVLDDLVAKLGTLPANHPDEMRLIRMIIGLRHELECGPRSKPTSLTDPSTPRREHQDDGVFTLLMARFDLILAAIALVALLAAFAWTAFH